MRNILWIFDIMQEKSDLFLNILIIESVINCKYYKNIR